MTNQSFRDWDADIPQANSSKTHPIFFGNRRYSWLLRAKSKLLQDSVDKLRAEKTDRKSLEMQEVIEYLDKSSEEGLNETISSNLVFFMSESIPEFLDSKISETNSTLLTRIEKYKGEDLEKNSDQSVEDMPQQSSERPSVSKASVFSNLLETDVKRVIALSAGGAALGGAFGNLPGAVIGAVIAGLLVSVDEFSKNN